MFIKTNNIDYNIIHFSNSGNIVFELNIPISAIGESIELYSSDDEPMFLKTFNPLDYNVDVIGNTLILKTKQDLNIVRTNKIEELSNNCTETIYAGIDVTLSTDEVQHFTLDEQDQSNLAGLGLQLAAGASMISWHCDDQTKACQFYTAVDATKIIQSLTAFKSYHITYFRDLRIYVNSLTTAEEIEQIYYGYPLPEEAKSQVLKVLESQLA